MADRIAASPQEGQDSEALSRVDGAIDSIIAAMIEIEENLPKVEVTGVPQRAARDVMEKILNEALKPYMVDMARAIQVFETTK